MGKLHCEQSEQLHFCVSKNFISQAEKTLLFFGKYLPFSKYVTHYDTFTFNV